MGVVAEEARHDQQVEGDRRRGQCVERRESPGIRNYSYHAVQGMRNYTDQEYLSAEINCTSSRLGFRTKLRSKLGLSLSPVVPLDFVHLV